MTWRRVFIAALIAWSIPYATDAQLRLQPFASGFALPIGFIQDPVDPSVHYVVEQPGTIRVLRGGVILAAAFLDLTGVVSCCGERGLLGLAFAPDYAVSGRFYVNFTNADGHTVIARFKRSAANPHVADPASRFDLRWASLGNLPFIPHEPAFGNHNGGDIVFGPDGFLYVGMGDGGSGDDPFNRAQSPDTLLGKMLRIDVNVPDANPNGYRVPAGNPFVGGSPIAALPEIWDFGMRNPWRFSFDVGNGGSNALVIADVGQANREEIDWEPAAHGGRNYGWSIREGTRPNVINVQPAFLPLVDPVYEYDHTVGNVITGGFTYRGAALNPIYRGRYFFADFGTGRVWSIGTRIDPATGEAALADLVEHTAELGGPSFIGAISTFGRDADGELYAVQYSGAVLKLITPPDPVRALFAADLNGDGRPDVVSQGQHGNVTAALSSGVLFDRVQRIYDDLTSWRVVGLADFDGDDKPDLLWQGPTGAVAVWLTRASGAPQVLSVYGGESDWRVAAAGDVDGDGNPDLIWQGPTGRVVAWLMAGIQIRGTREIWAHPSDWRIAGAGDFDGDGTSDLLWQAPSGALVAWTMRNASAVSSTVVYAGASDWRIASVGDLDGDRQPDLLWLGPNGQAVVWHMNGTTLATARFLTSFGLEWTLADP